MPKDIVSLALCCCFCMFVVPIASSSASTLEETLRYAYSDSPLLKAEWESFRATQEKVPQAYSEFLPSIEGRADYAVSDVTSDLPFIRGSERRKPRKGELVITQEIFNGFASVAKVRQAYALEQQAMAVLESTRQDVLLRSASAFFAIVRDKQLTEIARKSEAFFIEQLKSTEDRFQVGEVTFTDVAQAKARLAQAHAETVRSQGNYAIAQAQYRDIVGQAPPDNPITSKFTFSLPKTLEKSIDVARTNHPLLQNARYGEYAARYRVHNAIGQLLPSLKLEGRGSRSFDTFSRGSKSESVEVKALLTVPLWQGGAALSFLQEFKYDHAKTKHLLTQEQRTVDQRVASAWQNLEAIKAQIVSYKSQVQANRIAAQGVREEATLGDRTVLDVLDAENELFQSLKQLAQAEYDFREAVFQLLNAMGALTLDHIGITDTQ
ncbi:MAG: TolC family outer membrane protein [Alphaproteobacteria bacterium GM7ARS4]|nr:TolC family outer membrane protein [Alphaproteobacteria bacterium GM7ARS4]